MPGGYVSPYAARIAALTKQQEGLDAQDFGPMFTPEEQERRQTENARNYQLGVLSQLSGDKQMMAAGTPILKEAIAQRNRKVTEHGEYDPMTGQLNMFPEYKRQKLSDRLAKEQARLTEQEARGYDQYNRDRERAQDRMDLARLAASLKTPPNQGVTMIGVDETDNKPILLRHDGVMLKPGAKPGEFTYYSGTAPATRANAAKEKKALEDAEDAVIKVGGQIARMRTPAGREAYGTGVAGTVLSKLPIGRGIATNALFSNEEQKMRADVYADAYQEAVKIAGVAQTLGEKWRFEPFLPQPDDPDDVVLNKLETIHQKANDVLARKRARMGGQPVPGMPSVAPLGAPTPTAQNPPGSIPTINYDASGRRM